VYRFIASKFNSFSTKYTKNTKKTARVVLLECGDKQRRKTSAAPLFFISQSGIARNTACFARLQKTTSLGEKK